jgi:small conductance mechanosensitive channel
LVVLDALGINTAPLLAGAGVVGLAVGFGSQKLVQDIITGIFMLFEDTIAVGDVVDLGGHLGEVESLSIRSLRLRDYNGHVHTVPFSAVSTVVNLTKVYSYAVLDTRVRFEADTDQVSATMTAVVEELRADPAFGDLILDSIDLKGVDPFGDSSVKIVARLRTLPKKQWDVQREFNRRLKKVLEREGINLSIANHTINEVPPDDVLPSEPVGEHPAS